MKARVSAYILGSAVSGECCPGSSDLDVLVFHSAASGYRFVEGGEGVTVLVLPWPSRGLVYEWGWNRPSALATKMFISTPKRHVFGERVEAGLRRDAEVEPGELASWCSKRRAGASLGLEDEDYRRTLKNYVKSVWAFYALHHLEPRTFTWRGFARALSETPRPRQLEEAHVRMARRAARRLASCSQPSREEAEECLLLCEELEMRAIEFYLERSR